VFAVPETLRSRDGRRRTAVEAVVDTGATFTEIQRSMAVRLGLVAEFRSRSRVGDGGVAEREVGPLQRSLGGLTATVPVVIDGEGDIPVLGATALEILGLWVDPTGRTLVPREGA
jgi:predicted aspartyl protease